MGGRKSLCAGAALGLAISPAGADIRITSDQGGALDQQLQRVEAARQSGDRVIIDGPCNSACTLWLSLPPAQLCVTLRATFGFHSAMDPVTGMPSPKWNEALMRAYPPHVRNLISRRGGLWWTTTIYVRGIEIVRRCN